MKYTSRNPNGINQITGSAVAVTVLNNDVAVFTTSSLNLSGSLTASSAIITGNVIVQGTASINTLVVNQTQLSTGSNQLGDAVDDVQTLFGTVRIPTGSLNVTGSSIMSGSLNVTGGITGSLFGTASYIPNLNEVTTAGNTTTNGVTVGSLNLSSSVEVTTANAFGLNYFNVKSLTAGQGISAGFLPSGSPTGFGYNFQFNKSDTSNANSLLFIGGGSSAIGNSANKHVISTSADGTALGQPLVLRVATTGINWASVSDHLTIFPGGNVVLQNTAASATDSGFRLDVNGTGRFSGNVQITGSATNSLLVKGSGTTSSTTALRVENSSASPSLIVLDNGFIGVGTATDSGFKLDVSGSGRFTNSLTVTGSLTVITGSAIEFQVNQTGVKIGNALTDSHQITGSVAISSSAGTGSALTVYKSGSTVVSIQGSQGELFSITDSLSGSLFSVSNISGLPILEVFSDNTVLLGSYLDPMLITTQRLTANSGSTVIYSLPTASYDGIFVDYVIRSGSNARAGQIMGLWSGSTATYVDNSTTDFGSTAGFNFGLIISSSNMVLTGSASTSGWTVRAGIRSI